MTQNQYTFPQPSKQLEFDGERHVSGIAGTIRHEQHQMYLFALELCRGKTVLDIACGEGYGSSLIGQVAGNVVGIDPDEAAIAVARSTYATANVQFIVSDTDPILLDDNAVDVVICFGLIGRLEGQGAFLQEIARVLRPEGTLIISAPNLQNRDQFRKALAELFANVRLYDQRPISGSAIIADGTSIEIESFESASGLTQSDGSDAPSIRNFVAIASDGALPAVASNLLYDDSYVANLRGTMTTEASQSSSLARALAEANEKNAHLRNFVERETARANHVEDVSLQLTDKIASLKSSLSWRLTAPVREIGRMILRLAQSEQILRIRAAWRHPTNPAKRKRFRAAQIAARNTPTRPARDAGEGGTIDSVLFRRYVRNAVGNPLLRDFVELSAEETPAAACDVKLIAYYLPQFHPIPENDKWWGKGFTEWRNVTRAFPVFADHYQPRVPGELGYYDLRVIDTMRRQVELAKQHGITAFCFHFYWFAGKRLLELPIESFLNNKDLDLQFALSWANENWSKRWDGGNNELLIAQNHSREDDIAFIRYIDRYFKDDRYMKVDGKPVLSVYRPAIIDHMKDTIAVWRQQALELGYPGIYLIATSSFNFKEFAEYGFDALSEFPPHSIQAEQLQDKLELASVRTGGPIYSYESLVDIVTSRPPVAPGMIHPGAIPSWDNSARRPFDGHIFHGASPALFARWLRHCFKVARGHRPEERFVFINAWNEWAEGAYLEPDQRYGYAYLAACAEVVRENSAPDPTGKRISAIVPNYNHAPFLEERLNSILGQSQSVAEIIILDDASTDDSRAVIARAIEGATIPVRVIVNEQNSGSIFGQWAKGIELAQGDLIWICESDDSCDPDFLKTLSPQLDDPSVLLAFGKVNYIDRDGNPSPDLDAYREGIRPGYWDAPHIESAQTWFDGAFGIANVIPNVGGCLFRKQRIDPQLLQELLSYKVCGDWYLYSRFAHGGRIAYEPKALAYFRRHGANTSVLSYRGDAFYEEHVALAKALRRHHRVSIETTRKMLDRVQDHYRSTFGESAASQFIERFPFRDIVSEPRTIQHIVIALYGLQTGGGEIFPIHLANELSRRGHDVSLLIATTENSNARVRRLVAPGIPIFTQDFVESIGLERFLRDYGVDLIHTHNIVSDMWLHQKLASVDIPYVVTHHGSYEAVPLDPSLVNWLLRNVDQWVYISDKNLNYTKGLRVERDRFTQLPNAMPSSTGAFAFTRAELGIEPDAFVFGLASRAVYSKGWDVAIRALVALRKETDRPVHLLLCGDGDDLVALKRNYGQVPGVHFLGYQDNIQSFYGLCDCCILPTRYVGESYPLTLVEALQAGTPVIATDIGEISKILQIQDRPLGLTFPLIEDDAAFEANVRQAMKRMLDADYYAVIASNLADGRALLSMEKLVVSYEEIYTRASGSGQPLAAEGNRRS